MNLRVDLLRTLDKQSLNPFHFIPADGGADGVRQRRRRRRLDQAAEQAVFIERVDQRAVVGSVSDQNDLDVRMALVQIATERHAVRSGSVLLDNHRGAGAARQDVVRLGDGLHGHAVVMLVE